MWLILKDDKTASITINSPTCIRGLRAKEAVLDATDIDALLNMHEEDIVRFLLTMRCVMISPSK